MKKILRCIDGLLKHHLKLRATHNPATFLLIPLYAIPIVEVRLAVP